VLIVTGYSMGSLYEHKAAQIDELRETYHGVLMILRHFIARDTFTENHSYRVSVYAAKIASSLDLSQGQVEDTRAAALLHDIGKLDISRDLLYKAARLTRSEYEQMKQHVSKGVAILEPVGGSLRRVIPIVLAHHDEIRRNGLPRERWSRHTDRSAHHLGGRCLRLADERSAVPQGDVAVRGQRYHHQRVGYGLRPPRRRRVSGGVPQRGTGAPGGSRLISKAS
jgi:uncharacterized domain HDIG